MDPRYIHVGSWNIEHFGKANDASDENPYAICEHIELAGIDVLALQEIYVTDESTFTNEYLNRAMELLKEHTGQDWVYELFPNRFANDRSQLCGMVWNASRLTKVGETKRLSVKKNFKLDGETYWLWDRAPHAIKLSAGEGRTDIALINLHMKANTGERHIVVETRHQEAKTLVKAIKKLRNSQGEQDIILLGDTNCKSADEPALEVFKQAGFKDLNEKDCPTYYRGDAPFDRILVPRAASRVAFKYSRQYVLQSADRNAHDRYLSDHYIIKTTVKIRRDDDENGIW